MKKAALAILCMAALCAWGGWKFSSAWWARYIELADRAKDEARHDADTILPWSNSFLLHCS